MRRNRLLCSLLAAGTLAAMAGCGGEGEGAGVDGSAGRTAIESEYHEVLLDFRDAAAAGEGYDAYGFAEYFPKTQRAAVHAFCFVADRMLEDGEADELADAAYLTARVTRKAEADLKAELDIVAPGPARRAIAKLWAILGLDSLDEDLAERYAGACY